MALESANVNVGPSPISSAAIQNTPGIDLTGTGFGGTQTDFVSNSFNAESLEVGKEFGVSSIGQFSGMSAVNSDELSGMDKSSSNNESIQSIERRLYGIRPGKVVMSNRSAYKTNAVIVSEDGVTLTSAGMISGLSVRDSGVNIQGVTYFSGKGTSIRKGEFSENPNSSNTHTYRDIVDKTSIPESLRSMVEAIVPAGTEDLLGEKIPFFTDIAPGPAPHAHLISTKHVHRIDPAYLYRVPQSVDIIKGAMGSLGAFFSEKFSAVTKLVGTL